LGRQLDITNKKGIGEYAVKNFYVDEFWFGIVRFLKVFRDCERRFKRDNTRDGQNEEQSSEHAKVFFHGASSKQQAAIIRDHQIDA